MQIVSFHQAVSSFHHEVTRIAQVSIEPLNCFADEAQAVKLKYDPFKLFKKRFSSFFLSLLLRDSTLPTHHGGGGGGRRTEEEEEEEEEEEGLGHGCT